MGKISQLFEFFRVATTYITPDPDSVAQAGESATRHSNYHFRVVVVAALFAVIGLLGGIAGAAMAITDPGPQKPPLTVVLIFPLLGGAGGALLGSGAACLFAPKEFLTGPIGLKWMRLIGTENIIAARIVCFVASVIVPLGIASLFLFLPNKK